MLSKEPIFYVMTKEIVVASTTSKFSQVQKLFLEHNVSHLPVMDGNELVGIISNFDIMRAYAKTVEGARTVSWDHLDDMFTVTDWMTKNPKTFSSKDTIADAAKALTENNFEALPIVDEDELVGIITTKDLVSYLSQMFEKD